MNYFEVYSYYYDTIMLVQHKAETTLGRNANEDKSPNLELESKTLALSVILIVI